MSRQRLSRSSKVNGARPRPLGRRFGLFWAGESINVVGTSTTAALIPLVAVFGLGAGPQWVGVLTAAAWLPWLLIGIPAGVLVDTGSPRRLMIMANLLSVIALATVPAAAWMGSLGLAQLAVVALIVGGCTVVFRTAYPVFVTTLVKEHQLERANARLFGSESAGNAVGPGLAGSIAQFLGAASGMTSQVIGLAVSTGCLLAVGNGSARLHRLPSQEWRERLLAGLRLVFGDRFLRSLTLVGGIANFGHTGMATLMVLYLAGDLGLQPVGIGVVLSVGMIGGVLGAVAAPQLAQRFGSGRISLATMVVQAVTILIPLGPNAPVVALGLLITSMAVVAGNVVRGAWRQRYVPPTLLGRVASASQLVNYGTMPVAAVVAGLLGEVIGVRTTLLIMVAVIIAAGIVLRLGPHGRLRELPSRT